MITAPRTPGLALAAVELRALLRRPGATVVSALLPVVLLAMTYVGTRPGTAAEWGATLGNYTVITVLVACYMNATTILASRRDLLVLKRLRTSEVSGTGLILSVFLPLAGIVLVQLAVLYPGAVLTGAPLPERPGLLLLAVVSAVPTCLALAAATTALTASAERAQFAVLPVFVSAALGGQVVGGPFSDALVWSMLTMPLVPSAALVGAGWGGDGITLPLDLPLVPSALALNLLWCAAALVLAVRLWRWEPRP
ncbi:hypothetical protein IDM40_22610 [Nocardiopsis sp. HNM0947]|uniref:ABC-2 type transport system permease protein n=1 Tax=Nocardiopsis coralli TaxID=2772213 RepID=A0ABR9PC89_9ACTN|nr:hypothetical protein [Nocardiopsis coralli]MBE3001462.1 hypothetical protein [Nocardiopsis coralli]